MPVCADKGKNIETARRMIGQAAEAGAQMVMLPEMFCCLYASEHFRANAEEAGDKVWTGLSDCARDCNIVLVGGSMPETEDGRIYNTCFVFNEKGEQIARHRKVHLFDIDVEGGQSFKESDTFTRGDSKTVFDCKYGRFGVMICFDIRFPELSRLMMLDGAQAIFVPAAFNMTTGPAHWEISFRQRALDNELYMLGCAPARDSNGVYVSYANSIVTGPWGNVIARADENGCILYADIDLEENERIRRQLPLITARRSDIYSVSEIR